MSEGRLGCFQRWCYSLFTAGQILTVCHVVGESEQQGNE